MTPGVNRDDFSEPVREDDWIEYGAGRGDQIARERDRAHCHHAGGPLPQSSWRPQSSAQHHRPQQQRAWVFGAGGEPRRDRRGPQPAGLPPAVMEYQEQQAKRGELREKAVIDQPARVIRQFPGEAEDRRRQCRLPPPAGQRPYRQVDPEDPERAHHHEDRPCLEQVVRRVERREHRCEDLAAIGTVPSRAQRIIERRHQHQHLADTGVDVWAREEDAVGDHRPRGEQAGAALVPVEAEVDSAEPGDHEQRDQQQRRQAPSQPISLQEPHRCGVVCPLCWEEDNAVEFRSIALHVEFAFSFFLASSSWLKAG